MLPALRETGVEVREAGVADAVAGVAARFVAAPASTQEAAAVLRVAAAHDLAVVVRGAGTKQDWAAPPRRLDLVLDTTGLTGVVEHVSGDLVVVVRAGTQVAELRATLAGAGQQLALDTPWEDATVGGTIAADTSGPRRMAYGTLRDLLIGITVVRPDGVIARAGGKVVKNVAGYDLGKLFTGSYGTLGLITEAVFRLHPLPGASGYVLCRVPDPAAAGRCVSKTLDSQWVPAGVELDASPGRELEVAVRLEGMPEALDGRAAAAAAHLGGTVCAEPGWWARYPWRGGDVGIKLTSALSRVPVLVERSLSSRDALSVPLTVRGSAGTGVLYAGFPGDTEPGVAARLVRRLREAAHECGGHAVVLTAPPPIRDRLDLWGLVPGLDLMRRVKRQFDPDARFAPGRFVGGI